MSGVLSSMNGGTRVSKSDTCEFSEQFEAAANWEALQEHQTFEHIVNTATKEYLNGLYDGSIWPISKAEGERLTIYWHDFVAWCSIAKDTCLTALPAKPMTVAGYLHDCTDNLQERAEAIQRMHYLADEADPVHHPLVGAILDNRKVPVASDLH